MATYTDKVSEATKELSESVGEVNRVFADSVVAAGERNLKFAQSVMEREVELFKSYMEGTRSMQEHLAGEPEKGPVFFQSVADGAVTARKRNAKFVQDVLEDGTEVLRSHVEGTRTLMHTLTEESHKQREAFGVLVRGTWDAYRGFLPSPIRFYERVMESAESLATEGADTAQKMVHHEKPAVHAAKK